MKLLPVSVIVLLRYAELGEMLLLNVGDPTTVNALLLVVITTVSGLLIFSWTPALPTLVVPPMMTTASVSETKLHEKALEPDDGLLPNLAEHVCDMRKLVPVSVIVLPMYPATGVTESLTVGTATTVNALLLVVITTVSGLLIVSWTPALPKLVPVPTTT